MRSRRAFTLIEVLVVMSLLGVLFGLSIGMMAKAGRGNALLQGANSLVSQIATARSASYGEDTAYVRLEAREDASVVIRTFRQRQVLHYAFEDFEKASENVISRSGQVEVQETPIPSGEGLHGQFSGGTISLGNPAFLQFVDGFSIRCMLNPRIPTRSTATSSRRDRAWW